MGSSTTPSSGGEFDDDALLGIADDVRALRDAFHEGLDEIWGPTEDDPDAMFDLERLLVYDEWSDAWLEQLSREVGAPEDIVEDGGDVGDAQLSLASLARALRKAPPKLSQLADIEMRMRGWRD